jgi:hypothetical protein
MLIMFLKNTKTKSSSIFAQSFKELEPRLRSSSPPRKLKERAATDLAATRQRKPP